MGENSLARDADVLASSLTSTLRGWTGIVSTPAAIKPEKTLELYEFEGCPYCRLVREALTELDIDVIVYPCPKRGQRFRPKVVELGGKAQFPFLVDPNTGVQMYESMDIVAYLYETYGQRDLPLKWRVGALQKISSIGSGIPRLGRGVTARPSKAPSEMLELYSFEASPFARPVRELLCQMEIPYILRSCGRSEKEEWLPPKLRETLNIRPKSELPNRIALMEKEGKMAIPYLYDPNSGEGLFESGEIFDYLKQLYK